VPRPERGTATELQVTRAVIGVVLRQVVVSQNTAALIGPSPSGGGYAVTDDGHRAGGCRQVVVVMERPDAELGDAASTQQRSDSVCVGRPSRSRILTLISHRLVAWHSGRTSVSGRRTFPVLRSTCS